MKTIKELNIKDWSGYFFTNMTILMILILSFYWSKILKAKGDG